MSSEFIVKGTSGGWVKVRRFQISKSKGHHVWKLYVSGDKENWDLKGVISSVEAQFHFEGVRHNEV